MINPEKILNSFNTHKFKREQPDSDMLLTNIKNAIVANDSISFCKYWGMGKTKICQPEIDALLFLKEFRERIDYDVVIDLIFTDTHADLNGFPEDEITSYFQSFKNELLKYDFIRLNVMSDILVKFPKKKIYPEPSQEQVKVLMNSSEKHYKKGSPKEGAIKYYYANMYEREVVKEKFQKSIFITYNGSEISFILPELPKFYMFSTKQGNSEKPWFIDCT